MTTKTYRVRCDECADAAHFTATDEGRAWDEARAHEGATGHTTYVALARAAIRQATGQGGVEMIATRTTKLSDAQARDLRDVDGGLTRGESAAACEALVRRGLLRGDWITGYYVTRAGARYLATRQEG